MSSRVNLNDNVSDRFEFSVGGLDYDLVYPSLNEIEPITNLYQERDETDDEKKKKEIEEKLSEALYSLIVPVGHNTPIEDTLKAQPFPVIKAFNEMISKQLSAE